jgi:membrane protein
VARGSDARTDRDPRSEGGDETRQDRRGRGRDVDVQQLEREYPGAGADKPTQVPGKGWWQILRRGMKEFSKDQMSLIAAGVAFKAFLALVPTFIAAMLIYGLVSSPSEVARQVQGFSGALPQSARQLLQDQLTSLAAASKSGLSFGVIVSLLLALWSASGGTQNLMQAVNDAYDEQETRGWIKRKALALALTLGAIIFFAVAASLVAVFPAVANALGLSGFARAGVEGLRWVVLLIFLGIALAVLYRLAPNRDDPQFKWASVGAAVAVVIWIVASIVFSLYVDNFGKYGKTYGTLAGVVVLLLWLWISVIAVLLGAEINAEAEKQTVKDTTTGPERPMGERRAVKADIAPSDPDPDPDGRPDDGGRG